MELLLLSVDTLIHRDPMYPLYPSLLLETL
jgi:hypothetical protein